MRKLLLLMSFALLSQVAYSQLSSTKVVEPKSNKEEIKIGSENVLSINNAIKDYNYPQLKNTGNKDADYAEYKKAKDSWIAKNPDLYIQMQTPINRGSVSTSNSNKKKIDKK